MSGTLTESPPRVSIGVPVYNGETYLPQALDSLLAQTYPDFEIVISDNASTDATENICRDYANRDKRIRYYREAVNRGLSWNFNRVFELSRGEYFKWAAADDICVPGFVERCVDVLEEDKSIVCCHARTTKIDPSGRKLTQLLDPTSGGSRAAGKKRDASSRRVHRRFLDVLLSSGWSARSYGVFRASSLRLTGLIKPYYGWEKVLMGELSLMGRFHDLPDVLFYQRIHENASSNLYSAAEQQEIFDPSMADQQTFPRLRLLQGHLWSVWRHPLSPLMRLLCLGCIVRYLFQVSKWSHHFISVRRGIGVAGASRNELSTLPHPVDRDQRH